MLAVRLYEIAFRNCTKRKEYVFLHMTIVTFIVHPFDKPMGEWYSDVGILRKKFLLFNSVYRYSLFLKRRAANETF